MNIRIEGSPNPPFHFVWIVMFLVTIIVFLLTASIGTDTESFDEAGVPIVVFSLPDYFRFIWRFFLSYGVKKYQKKTDVGH